MQTNENYRLTIQDLFTSKDGLLCGDEAIVAIFDEDTEVDRLSFRGKVGPSGRGYSRSYTGKPGLTAKLLTAVGRISLTAIRP